MDNDSRTIPICKSPDKLNREIGESAGPGATPIQGIVGSARDDGSDLSLERRERAMMSGAQA
jgi:hypothetical protein